MPKPIARSKTRKSVAKRFKITARGKVSAGALFSTPFAVMKKCKAEAPFEQSGARGRNGCRPRQGKPAIRLRALSPLSLEAQESSLASIGARLLAERFLRFEWSLPSCVLL